MTNKTAHETIVETLKSNVISLEREIYNLEVNIIGNKNSTLDITDYKLTLDVLLALQHRSLYLLETHTVVPNEPTEEMLDKGEYVNSEWLNDYAPIGQGSYRDPAKAVYKTMLKTCKKTPENSTCSDDVLKNQGKTNMLDDLYTAMDHTDTFIPPRMRSTYKSFLEGTYNIEGDLFFKAIINLDATKARENADCLNRYDIKTQMAWVKKYKAYAELTRKS